MRLALLLIIFVSSACSQTDWQRWKKEEISYKIPDDYRKREYSFVSENIQEFLIKSLTNTYWFFISDLDGDNCPFHPSCSAFLLESVKETNILQGTLMFFDRFTRDMNLIDKKKHYPVIKNGRYFDPPAFYTLNSDTLISNLSDNFLR
ncbi:MAG: membrane protein insertion efficiency factor YidD [Ignavibacteriaceae bacterium]|nr:membrane protein insertion efficiency factor YidD [Ignavibacteriaceae bacterium]